jgi:outer membrane protein assembly factor BamD (BamD/ComL family)
MKKKEYQVILSFNDVITIVAAKNEEDAKELAIEKFYTNMDRPIAIARDVEEVR